MVLKERYHGHMETPYQDMTQYEVYKVYESMQYNVLKMQMLADAHKSNIIQDVILDEKHPDAQDGIEIQLFCHFTVV